MSYHHPEIMLVIKNVEDLYNEISRISMFAPEKLEEFFEKNLAKSNESIVQNIFIRAVKQRRIKIIHFLLSKNIKIQIFNEYNQTAIHLAALQGYLEIIDELFTNCNNDINFTDVNGLSHFHIACMIGNFNLVKKFIDQGINVDLGTFLENESNYYTALHLAVKYLQVDVVELLLKNRADPNAVDDSGNTPLHLACIGYNNQINFLKKRQIFHGDMITAYSTEDENELEIIKLLVKHGSNVNAKDRFGNTPLLLIFKSNVEDHLISRIQPLYIWTYNGKRNMITDFRKSQKKKLEYLLKNRADAEVRNKAEDTVLHLTIDQFKTLRLPQCLLDIDFDDRIIVDMIRLILENGVTSVNTVNEHGETPLQRAISFLSLDAVLVFIQYGADVADVRFDSSDGVSCFRYFPDVLPCLEAVENLLKIIEVLEGNGFRMSSNDDLAVLKFLIDNNKNCQYDCRLDNNRIFKMKNLLELGEYKF